MHKVDGSLRLAEAHDITSLFQSFHKLAAAPSRDVDLVAHEVQAYRNIIARITLLSQQLAQDAEQRKTIVDSGLFDSVFQSLCNLYPVFEKAQAVRPQAGEDELNGAVSTVEIKEKSQDPYYRITHVATLCLRVLRNGMAGCSEAQAVLSERFDLLQPYLTNITRFHTLNDPDTLLLSRAAIQMLSNLITANRQVQRQMWSRIVMTDRDENKLVLRFLSSPDTATQSAAQILLINFLRTGREDTYDRCYELCTLPSGLALIESMLSSSESIMLRTAASVPDQSGQDSEVESDIEGLEESLGFIYTIFAILFERGYSSLLLSALAPIEEISSESSPFTRHDAPVIASSQLTLLKILDSWLHLNQKQAAESSSSDSLSGSGAEGRPGPMMNLAPTEPRRRTKSVDLAGAGLAKLIDVFIQLSEFARRAMSSGIAKDGTPQDEQPQDRRLIGVHHGLLLLLQCLLSISMTADGWSEEYFTLGEIIGHGDHRFEQVSRALLSHMRRSTDFVDELVALLDQTHQYAPALSPFRPAETSTSSGSTSAGSDTTGGFQPLPQGHALSATGLAARNANATQSSYGFDHLKRDLVRVLGSLVYAPTPRRSTGGGKQEGDADPEKLAQTNSTIEVDTHTHTKSQIREVQDRVRETGGLFHVLNMTVLDERNPCKSGLIIRRSTDDPSRCRADISCLVPLIRLISMMVFSAQTCGNMPSLRSGTCWQVTWSLRDSSARCKRQNPTTLKAGCSCLWFRRRISAKQCDCD